MTNLPICESTELPRLLCHHCDSFTMEPVEIAYLSGQLGPGDHVPAHPTRVCGEYEHLIQPLPEYRTTPWVAPRDVKVADSTVICRACGRCPSGDAFVCNQCIDDLEVALGDTPALIEDLTVLAMREVNFVGVAAGADRTPLPVALDATERIHALTNELTTTVRMLCEHRGLPSPALGDAEACSRWLLTNIRAVALDVGGPDSCNRIIREANRARLAIDRPEDRVYIGLCAKCSTPLHARRHRAEHRCTTCGETYEVAAMLEVQRTKVAASLLTLKEISDLSDKWLGGKITLKQLEGLVRRKRLAPAGAKPGPKPVALYRAADVVAIMADRAS